MKKGLIFLIILISSILAQDDDYYDQLLNETVSEEYCTSVISNFTELLKEGYVYLDYYKSPIKTTSNEIYSIEPLDLIKELEAIPTKNRKFYEFIRDIYKITRKTRDGHLGFICTKSPNGILLNRFLFTIPFSFGVVDELDDDGNRNDTYLVIQNDSDNSDDDEDFDSLFIKKSLFSNYDNYYNKKIISINGEDPFQYIENFFGDFKIYHSSQTNYIDALDTIKSIPIGIHPFLKEELENMTIVFEDDDEITINYEANYYGFLPINFANYYLEKQKKVLLIIYHYQISKKFIKSLKKKIK